MVLDVQEWWNPIQRETSAQSPTFVPMLIDRYSMLATPVRPAKRSVRRPTQASKMTSVLSQARSDEGINE